MIPILFAANETNFTSNGIGSLSDAITCKVIEERNGKYVLEMTYPVDGNHYGDIVYSNYIYAIPSDGASKQPFRIYKITKPMNGIIQVYAEHRSYQLRNIPTYSISANNASQAFTQIAAHSAESNPFTFWTDVQTSASMTITEPTSIRSVLGGIQGSVLDTYGGEYEWDNLTVKLHTHRGANRGVQLCYGKNITDIAQEENIENAVTGVCPFWKSQESIVTLDSNDMVVYSQNASLYPYHRTVCVDFSREFDEEPTKAQLRAKAQSYVNNLGKPHVSIKVSFAALWQTKEYEHIANLERVKLCDTVTVYFEKLGIEAQAKVVKTDYNVLLERYNSIELGDAVRSLDEQIVEMANEVREAATSSDMMKAIAHATELITGGLGGHVVMKSNANGEPEEILIMDTDDVTTAVNVIRMNLAGIGFSTTGYNGPFTTAWTIDGHFVADFITSGTLRSITITGTHIDSNTITASAISGGTISGTTIAGSTINGDAITGGTITGAEITNGTSLHISSAGTLRAFGVDITNTDASGNYVGLNPNLPQIDIVSTPISAPGEVPGDVWHEKIGCVDFNSLRFIRNYVDGRGLHQGYGLHYGVEGWNMIGQVGCTVYQDGYDDSNVPIYKARFNTDKIFSASGNGVSIFAGTQDDSYSYEWRFQNDGNLVLYDSNGQWIWSLTSSGQLLVH